MKYSYKLQLTVIIFTGILFTYSVAAQDSAEGFIKHIKSLMVDGRNKTAIEELNLFLQKDSANVDALYYLGLNYEEISDYSNAAKVLGRADKLNPGNILIMQSLGRNCFYAGRIFESEAILSHALLLDSTNSHILILLGKVFMSEKKWREACKMYYKIILSDSTNSFFYQQLGEIYSHLDNNEEALRCYRLAYNYNPLNKETIVDLVYLLYINGSYHEALNILTNGLQRYQLSSELWKWKGDIYRNYSLYDSAIICYQRAYYCGDSTGGMIKNLGICSYWLKNYQSAENFLEHAIEVNSKDYESYFYLGSVYKNQNKLGKALEQFKQADTLLQNQSLADVYIQIGSVYQIQKKYKEALEYYKDALREYPPAKANAFYVAAMYDKLKNNGQAIFYYKMFLNNNGGEDPKLIAYAKDRITGLKK